MFNIVFIVALTIYYAFLLQTSSQRDMSSTPHICTPCSCDLSGNQRKYEK